MRYLATFLFLLRFPQLDLRFLSYDLRRLCGELHFGYHGCTVCVCAEGGVEAGLVQSAGEELNLRAVDAGERAEVPVVAQTAGVQVHKVSLTEQAQVALGVGQKRAQSAGAYGIQHIQPPLRQQVLRQFNQDVILVSYR